MTHKTGTVIGKRNKYGIFGMKKCYIQVQFEQKYDREGHNKCEFEVKRDLFSTIMIGAFVRGKFEQTPQGLRPASLY